MLSPKSRDLGERSEIENTTTSSLPRLEGGNSSQRNGRKVDFAYIIQKLYIQDIIYPRRNVGGSMAMSRALTKAALALWYFNLVLNLWLKAVPSEAFKNRISRTTFDRNGLERISSARWGQNGPHVTERRNMLRILRPSSDRNGGEREKNRRRSKRDGAISRNSFINTIITRLYMASSSGSGENATSRNRKSENVDLFAAGDRKILTPISPSSRTISSTPTQATVSAKSTLSSLANRTSDIGLQVELLRLEAEKEQLLIDRQRLEEEKVAIMVISIIIIIIITLIVFIIT